MPSEKFCPTDKTKFMQDKFVSILFVIWGQRIPFAEVVAEPRARRSLYREVQCIIGNCRMGCPHEQTDRHD